MKTSILGLKLPTDPRWVNMAEMDLEEILTDHAYCEQKAATSCISLIQMYPERIEMVRQVAPVVTEEWGHFRLVLSELDKRKLKLGRQRKDERWGPRTLDLDILLFGEQTISTERLTVPHYGLCEREFVVYPLLEVSPELKLPNGNTLADIAQQVPLNGLTPLELN